MTLLERVRRFYRVCGFDGPVTEKDVDDVREVFRGAVNDEERPSKAQAFKPVKFTVQVKNEPGKVQKVRSQPVLTVAQAALELAVSERHIINLIEFGRLRAFNVAVDPLSTRATVRITRESIELFKKGGY